MARNNGRQDNSALDAPKGRRTGVLTRRPPATSRDRFGRVTEAIARAMGTPWFLVGLSGFVVLWMLFNTLGPESLRFDSAAIGFTALTLILSLQASYAAPLILLAQNRQDDRDRVQFEQDRQRSERNLADTEYLAREVVALRLALQDMASKEFIRAELRALLDELDREKSTDAGGTDTQEQSSSKASSPKASGPKSSGSTSSGARSSNPRSSSRARP